MKFFEFILFFFTVKITVFEVQCSFQIVSQHNKQLERRAGTQEQGQAQGKKKPKETSVFSEEDFEKMNKEWLKLY